MEVDELTGQQQLVMDGGQGDHCPDGMSRKTIVSLIKKINIFGDHCSEGMSGKTIVSYK